MEQQPITIHPEDVPKGYAVCYHEHCPHAATCARYAAGQVVLSTREAGNAVYPSSLKADGTCIRFRPLRTIRAAWGFRSLFHDVKHEDYALLRWEVISLFSSESDFWRYNRGHYKLSPERQEEILDIFRRHGYGTEDRRFDHYQEMTDFLPDRPLNPSKDMLKDFHPNF